MTDTETTTAGLEHCLDGNSTCSGCPYRNAGCQPELLSDAVRLIQNLEDIWNDE